MLTQTHADPDQDYSFVVHDRFNLPYNYCIYGDSSLIVVYLVKILNVVDSGSIYEASAFEEVGGIFTVLGNVEIKY